MRLPKSLSRAVVATGLILAAPLPALTAAPGDQGETLSLSFSPDLSELRIGGGEAGAPIALLVGTDPASIPIGGGLVVGVDPLVVVFGRLDGAGELTLPTGLEPGVIVGLGLHLQVAMWPAGNEQLLPAALSPVLSLDLASPAASQGAAEGDPSRVAVINHAPEFRITALIAVTESDYTAVVSAVVPSGGHALILRSLERSEGDFRAEVVVETPADGEIVTLAIEELVLTFPLGEHFESLTVVVDKEQRRSSDSTPVGG